MISMCILQADQEAATCKNTDAQMTAKKSSQPNRRSADLILAAGGLASPCKAPCWITMINLTASVQFEILLSCLHSWMLKAYSGPV